MDTAWAPIAFPRVKKGRQIESAEVGQAAAALRRLRSGPSPKLIRKRPPQAANSLYHPTSRAPRTSPGQAKCFRGGTACDIRVTASARHKSRNRKKSSSHIPSQKRYHSKKMWVRRRRRGFPPPAKKKFFQKIHRFPKTRPKRSPFGPSNEHLCFFTTHLLPSIHS
jgi:hypothetical protein